MTRWLRQLLAAVAVSRPQSSESVHGPATATYTVVDTDTEVADENTGTDDCQMEILLLLMRTKY